MTGLHVVAPMMLVVEKPLMIQSAMYFECLFITPNPVELFTFQNFWDVDFQMFWVAPYRKKSETKIQRTYLDNASP